MKYSIQIAFLFVFLITSCGKSEDPKVEKKESNFTSPEEYVENPSVTSAISESGISVNLGDSPPPLAGTYLADGEVTDASSLVSSIVGLPINSEIRLSNQTTSGKIDFQEKAGGLTVWGSGGYITGNSGKFTIWQESIQSGDEAGLPNDITINVALIMSGTKFSSGDLTAKGISIITKVETTNSQYNSEILRGIWWMWDADFDLQAETKSANIMLNGENSSNSLQQILKESINRITAPE